ncbi:hypothetical protein DFJ74DRAFT_753536 [Hyaloraphidium curvatum]|nr:hypothetical protein DFJ74DRAFT_753536 [Hyaloraphidium curvatum]
MDEVPKKRGRPRKAPAPAVIDVAALMDEVPQTISSRPKRAAAKAATYVEVASDTDDDVVDVPAKKPKASLKNGATPASAASFAASPPTPAKAARRKRGPNGATVNAAEKRTSPYRPVPSKSVRDRLKRAQTQPIFVLNREVVSDVQQVFHVLGSVGDVYRVTIASKPSCTCPDYLRHAGHETCKHCLAVLVKALKISPDNPLAWQIALTQSELSAIFANAPDPSAMASERVRRAFERATGNGPAGDAEEDTEGRRAIDEDAECPICYTELKTSDKLDWCRASGGCGNSVHSTCMAQWISSQRKAGKDVTCVYCRRAWVSEASSTSTGAVQNGAYLNLASVAGLSQKRDTSTYYQGPRRGYRSSYDYEDYY